MSKSNTPAKKGQGQAKQPSPAKTVPSPVDPASYAEAGDLPEPAADVALAQIEAEIQEALKQGERKQQAFSLDLVVKHHALDEQLVSELSAEEKASFFQQLTHLRLDRMHLGGALPSDQLTALPRLTHVYLQHNQLTSIAGLAALPALRFAALSHNRIEKVEGVSALTSLMFIDLSYNQLTDVEVQQLPQSICFMKVAGNPCTNAASGAAIKTKLLARLPKLRDLDGPLSDDDDNKEGSDESDSDDQGDDDTEQSEEQLDTDDISPIPPLPQISDEGLPGGSRGVAKAGVNGLSVNGVGGELQGTEEMLRAGSDVVDAGGSGRLVASALNMLEELERACFEASGRSSCASLRASMGRAMRSVAEHPGMRASVARHSVAGLLGKESGEDGSEGGLATGEGSVRGSVAADPKQLLTSSRPGSSSSGSSSLIKQGEPLIAGKPPLQPPLAPLSSAGQLRPVTPPLRSLSGSRSLSARRGLLGEEDSTPLPTSTSQQFSGMGEEALQKYIEADLDMLRAQLQALSEPLAAATANRPPPSPSAPTSTTASTSSKPTTASTSGAPASTNDSSAEAGGDAGAAPAVAKAVRGGKTRGGSVSAKSGRGSAAESGVKAGGKVGAGRGLTGVGRVSVGAGRGGRTSGGRGAVSSEGGKAPPTGQRAVAAVGSVSSKGAKAAAGDKAAVDDIAAAAAAAVAAAAPQGSESGSRPGSAAGPGRTLLWSASARAPSRGGPGDQSVGGSRPGSASVRPASASLRPGSSSHGGERPPSRGSLSAAGSSSAPAASSTDTDQSNSKSTWLREELERKMKAAAQRLYEQRARQEVLSAVIRSMRGGGGDEVTPESRLEELRSGLTLRAALEAGPGATGAVRSMLAASSQNPLEGMGEHGSVLSALRQHSMSETGPLSARAAAVADQDESLRSSMARLEKLTRSTKAALEARQGEGGVFAEQDGGVFGGLGKVAEESGSEVDDEAGKGGVQEASKYLQIIKKAKNDAQQQHWAQDEGDEGV